MNSFLRSGLYSTSSGGRKMSTVSLTDKMKKISVGKGIKKNLAVSNDEVRTIRILDSKGVSRRKIFEDHIKGKITYDGMVNILNYITRNSVKI